MSKNIRWLAVPALFALVALVNNGCSSNSDNDQNQRGNRRYSEYKSDNNQNYQNQRGSRRYAEDKRGEPIKRGCSRCGVRNRPTEE